MKTKLILILTFIFVITWTVGNSQNTLRPKYRTIIDADKGTKMLSQCSRSTPEKIDGFWELTEKDIKDLESNLKKVARIKASGCCISGIRINNLEEYGFQYIGVKIKNRKFIYVNAFWIESKDDMDTWYKDWETDPVIICDGGESYWGVLFNIVTSKFSQLSVNGIG